MALNKYEWSYVAAGPVVIAATYGIASAVAVDDNTELVVAIYAGLLWMISPLLFFAFAPVLTAILKALTNPREAFNKLVEFVKQAMLLASFGAACYGAFLIYSHYDVEWDCVERGNTMLSISEKGDLGPAEKACTCTGMADFERRKFGRVDYASLNKDHGCSFD